MGNERAIPHRLRAAGQGEGNATVSPAFSLPGWIMGLWVSTVCVSLESNQLAGIMILGTACIETEVEMPHGLAAWSEKRSAIVRATVWGGRLVLLIRT